MTATLQTTEGVDRHRMPVVGIIGGGQLARMCQQAAIPLGLELRVLCSDPSQGAGPVTPGALRGEPDDPVDLERLADGCDVITLDHELVDLKLLDGLIRSGIPVRPGLEALAAAVDKLELRRRLTARGLPVPRYEVVEPGRGLQPPEWSRGWVVKTARGGYDGRGVWFPADAEELTEILTALGDHRVIVEERIPDPVELAVLVARRPGGETVVYDPVRTYQRDGICIGLEAPSGVGLDAEARELARAVVEEVGAVGVCAVEMLVDDGELLVSEIATRPHNSAHHTIEAAVTSQFENHLRAVCDLPLGSGELAVAGVGLANLLGGTDDVAPRSELAAALAIDPGASVHLYGKTPRPGRKLGHVTVLDPDPRRGRERAARVASALGGADVTPEGDR